MGGGAVFFSLTANNKFINDKSSELFNLYRVIAQQNQEFFRALDILLDGWQHISKIVDNDADSLMKTYKAYSSDQCSTQEMTQNL